MKLFPSISLFIAGLNILALIPMMKGFPDGAGSCALGNNAVSGPHLDGSITTGTLPQGGFTVYLDSKPLKPSVPANFVIGKKHTITIKAGNSQYYRGFLIRLGGKSGVSTNSALSVVSGDYTAQVSQYCTYAGVGGITQTSSSDKTSTSVKLLLNKVASRLPLDVTIVIEADHGYSTYYYSRYLLNAVKSTPTPTSRPTLHA